MYVTQSGVPKQMLSWEKILLHRHRYTSLYREKGKRLLYNEYIEEHTVISIHKESSLYALWVKVVNNLF